MKRGLANAAVVLAISSAISIGCGSDDDSTMSTGGASGSAGASGKAGSNGIAGNSVGGKAGMSSGGNSNGGGPEITAGMGGTDIGEVGGMPNGEGGEAGAGGAAPIYTAAMVTRGTEIVRAAALCGGCHTATGGTELGGNPAFKNSTLPAPNLTSDATGLGGWTDEQIMNAFRNGVTDKGRHLDPAMPYWLFHNMSDADALAVVAFLRSLPKVSATVGATNPDATAVTPLAPSVFPDSSLLPADANYAAAQVGKYLVSGVAQCVRCHSPATAGLPSASFFSGVPPTLPPATNTSIFAPNITPDVTGISGWTADDVATALKVGKNKANVTLCGSMPSAAKGYGGLTDADAHAIGVYLTTIPAVSKAAADPSIEPACP
ncbi:MAG TPA: cytochrome c [Polyangiaceae bacterium]|jgi:mono/diheme cytochrome c family protein